MSDDIRDTLTELKMGQQAANSHLENISGHLEKLNGRVAKHDEMWAEQRVKCTSHDARISANALELERNATIDDKASRRVIAIWGIVISAVVILTTIVGWYVN